MGALQESDEEQEIAEALFDLANVAAMATASEQPASEAATVKLEEPSAALAPLLADADATAHLQLAAAAADAADPVSAMVSPRKRQRKPNRNLVLYEGFAGALRFFAHFTSLHS